MYAEFGRLLMNLNGRIADWQFVETHPFKSGQSQRLRLD